MTEWNVMERKCDGVGLGVEVRMGSRGRGAQGRKETESGKGTTNGRKNKVRGSSTDITPSLWRSVLNVQYPPLALSLRPGPNPSLRPK